MQDLFLVVGLGNPGKDYAATRHNAGFLAVERWGKALKADWRSEQKFESRVAKVAWQGREGLLCEPQTFMNRSGSAVRRLSEFYKIAPGRLVVVVDDADLSLSEIRLRPEGSSGGHHGLESVAEHLGTKNFARLRVGIGRTDAKVREITGHVLGRFAADEMDVLDRVLERVGRQLECWLEFGILKAMSQFNGGLKPPMAKES